MWLSDPSRSLTSRRKHLREVFRHAKHLFQATKVNTGPDTDSFKVSLARPNRYHDAERKPLRINLVLTRCYEFIPLLDVIVVVDIFHCQLCATGPLQNSKPPRRPDDESSGALGIE